MQPNLHMQPVVQPVLQPEQPVLQPVVQTVVTFRVSHRRREMYCGHPRLCVCMSVSVCLSAAACLHYCTEPDVTRGVAGDAP